MLLFVALANLLEQQLGMLFFMRQFVSKQTMQGKLIYNVPLWQKVIWMLKPNIAVAFAGLKVNKTNGIILKNGNSNKA